MRRLATLLALIGTLASCGDTSESSMAVTPSGAMTVSLTARPVLRSGKDNALPVMAQQVKVTRRSVLRDSPSSLLTTLRGNSTILSAGVRGAHPAITPGKRMALSVANLSEADIPNLAQLITTELPPTVPTTTLRGDAARGEDYYINICSACHGGNAQGNDALSAPALAGVNDWYLKSSYESYVDGLRGTHPDDFYGAQMARLAPALANSDDINDVIAFIATLPPQRTPSYLIVMCMIMRPDIHLRQTTISLAYALLHLIIGTRATSSHSPPLRPLLPVTPVRVKPTDLSAEQLTNDTKGAENAQQWGCADC